MLDFHETDFLRAFKLQVGLIGKEIELMKEKVTQASSDG